MENATYYLEGERLVFLTEEDARDYFFKEEIYHSVTLFYNLNEFLNDKGYNCEDVFSFRSRRKGRCSLRLSRSTFQALGQRRTC